MDWKQIYKEIGAIQDKPSKHVVEIIPYFRKNGVKKILDHGCGTGRHFNFLLNNGFETFGTDYSEEAISYTKNIVGEEFAKNLYVSDMSTIPFGDCYFDAIISSQTIQHALKPSRDKAISEIKRTLKINGLVFLRTISQKQTGFGLGELIEENTYTNIPGLVDGKNPHHYFSREELSEYFFDFNIILLKHYSNIPMNKHFNNGLEEWVLLARKIK